MNHQSKIQFTVRGNPKSQARHKMGRGFSYDPSKSDKANFMVLAHGSLPDQPIEGPISLILRFYMPIPKSWPKYKKKAAELDDIPVLTRPDIDNMCKFVMDGIDPYWNDDRQVYELNACKYYSHTPRTEVTIKY